MRKIIISAINLSQGGAMTILKECLDYLSENLTNKYEIIALVHNHNIFNHKNIKFYSFPKSKKSWLARLYYEYVYFYSFSKKLKPYLWLSLHDMTPNVKTDIQAVYCHNPSPFYNLTLKDVCLDFRFALFNFFYRYLYLINIQKNDFLIVQQEFLRKKFMPWTTAKIIVAHPTINPKLDVAILKEDENIFFYPALARVFKNFEIICKACEILLKEGVDNFQVFFTISGNENKYAKYIYNSFHSIKNIKFLGMQSREDIFKIYNNASCVIFPSKLETWGMPITEAKHFQKPLLLADLEYAHETLGDYNKVNFFAPDNPQQLALLMKNIISKKSNFEITKQQTVNPPFTQNWQELFDILLRTH